LLRARIIRQLARITIVDLFGTINNLTYEDIVSCEAIGEDIEVQPISYVVQPDIGSSCSDWMQYINEEEKIEVHEEEENQQQ